jgi:hypothetical protein
MLKSKFEIYNNLIVDMVTKDELLRNKKTEIVKRILKVKDYDKKNTEHNSFRVHLIRNLKRILDEHEGIYQATDELDVGNSNVKHLWLKNKKASVFIKNPNYIEPEENPILNIDFTKIFQDKITPIKLTKAKTIEKGYFDRVVYTDAHIGMNVNPNGFSLYGGKWDEIELEERERLIISFIIKNRNSNILYIDDLGDFMDGWDGETARKGHKLPQNMDNQKAFDVGLSFKVRMIDELVKYYDKIYCHNICNDNHSDSFGYVVNSAFKSIVEIKYKDVVQVKNIRHFIDHYKVGNYTFIICHGKDSKNLKFGFKAMLDKAGQEKIDDYIKEHFLYTNRDAVIEFSKGDSHQYIFDNSTSQIFNYYSYPALSPSSDWVQSNFKKGKSGLVMFNYYEYRSKLTHDLFFEWKR